MPNKKNTSKKDPSRHKVLSEIAAPVVVDRRSRAARRDEGKSMRFAVPLASPAQ